MAKALRIVSDVPGLVQFFQDQRLKPAVLRRAYRIYLNNNPEVAKEIKDLARPGRPSLKKLQELYADRAIETTSRFGGVLAILPSEARETYNRRGKTCEVCGKNPTVTRWLVYGLHKYPQHKEASDNMLFICRACCEDIKSWVRFRSRSTFTELVGELIRMGASQTYLESTFQRLINLEEHQYWDLKAGYLRELTRAGQITRIYTGKRTDTESEAHKFLDMGFGNKDVPVEPTEEPEDE